MSRPYSLSMFDRLREIVDDEGGDADDLETIGELLDETLPDLRQHVCGVLKEESGIDYIVYNDPDDDNAFIGVPIEVTTIQ